MNSKLFFWRVRLCWRAPLTGGALALPVSYEGNGWESSMDLGYTDGDEPMRVVQTVAAARKVDLRRCTTIEVDLCEHP